MRILFSQNVSAIHKVITEFVPDYQEMIKVFKITVLTAFAAASVSANAQNGVNSPYSRYGFGQLSDRSMGFNKGMGGIAQGYRGGQAINTANPASYSACDSLTALFDMGLSLQNGNYKMGGLQQNAKNTSFDYMAFQFRAAKNVGMSVAILPVSNIGYSFSSQSEALSGTENITSSYTFNGDGGLHKVMLGAGWRLTKPLSIGVNVGYLYGDYNHSVTMPFSQTTVNTMTRTYTADISTYSLDLGVQYIQPLGKNDLLTIGATYTLGHETNDKAYRTTMNSSTSSAQTTTDTLTNAFEMPHCLSVGFTYKHKDNLTVGADVELQKWSDVKFPNLFDSNNAYNVTTGQFNDKFKVAAGIAYTPDPYARSLGQKITYKAGGFYSKTYANVSAANGLSDKPYEYGLTAGLTIPIANSNSVLFSKLPKIAPQLHVSFQWTHTNVPYISSSTLARQTLSENYLKFCVGITFSDVWFYKWKVQ